MSEELRECPHCGATRGLYTLDEYGGLCVDDDLIAQIFCDNCKSAFENESANNGKELIEAWNTRAERTCEVTELSRKYILERTCKNIATNADDFCCSECNAFTKGKLINGFDYWYPIGKALSNCPNCGAKVVN